MKPSYDTSTHENFMRQFIYVGNYLRIQSTSKINEILFDFIILSRKASGTGLVVGKTTGRAH